MSIDYGQLKDIVAIAGSLMAAGSAIGLAWMRRAKWMPPKESVAGGTFKVSALICSVVVAILFLQKVALGISFMVWLSIACLVLAVIALGVSIYTNTTYSFVRRAAAKGGQEDRVLGGYKLTEEAREISIDKRMGHQQLYENSNYKSHLVWTPGSLALIEIASTMGFILLQASGSIALASVAIAFSLRTA